MHPTDRNLTFVSTVGVGLVIANEFLAVLRSTEKPKGLAAAFETVTYLVEVASQLLSSIFAAATGAYITDAVGGDSRSRPVYTLLLCTTIVGLLFLGRRALQRAE